MNRYRCDKKNRKSRISSAFILKKCLPAVIVFLASSVGWSGDFSCPLGTDGACLDWGDKVCSSFSKCVDKNASCFSEYTCGFQNEFVCKSDLDAVVTKYDELVRKFNRLVNEHDELIRKFNRLVDKHDELETCVSTSETLSAAKRCLV